MAYRAVADWPVQGRWALTATLGQQHAARDEDENTEDDKDDGES